MPSGAKGAPGCEFNSYTMHHRQKRQDRINRQANEPTYVQSEIGKKLCIHHPLPYTEMKQKLQQRWDVRAKQNPPRLCQWISSSGLCQRLVCRSTIIWVWQCRTRGYGKFRGMQRPEWWDECLYITRFSQILKLEPFRRWPASDLITMSWRRFDWATVQFDL